MNFRVIFFSLSIVLAGCATSKKDSATDKSRGDSTGMTVAFYNVENLFDTADDPRTMDEDFTSSGKLQWNERYYHTKLWKLAEVIDSLPGRLPAFIGLCEIENRKVLEDLVQRDELLAAHYAIIHKDSPDERGIDVAALYDSTLLKIEYFNYTTVNLPDEKDPYTRDLLYVKARSGNEIVHLFVNHWPSRGGGQAESEGNRIAVANVVNSQIRKIKESDKDARIIIMGDFNDHPVDKSIAEVLGAGTSKEKEMFNMMYDMHVAGTGSYFYKGEWGALDQFIVSWPMVNAKKGFSVTPTSAAIFKRDFILFTDNQGTKRPNRTYAGDDYKGGYSDHLPIYVQVEVR